MLNRKSPNLEEGARRRKRKKLGLCLKNISEAVGRAGNAQRASRVPSSPGEESKTHANEKVSGYMILYLQRSHSEEGSNSSGS